MNRKSLFFLGMLLSFVMIQGCRIVPVQMARVVQTDTYEQSYNITNEADAAKILDKLLGKKNFAILVDYLGSKEYIQEIKDKEIVVKGHILFTMSIHPTNHTKVLAEGFGRYYVLRKKTKELLISADYHIKEDYYSIEDIKKSKQMMIQIRQFMIRHFPTEGEKNYYNDTPLTFRVYMKELMEGVYSLDYEKQHELLVDGEVFGRLNFSKSLQGRKPIDMRSMGMLVDDYEVND